MATCRGSLAMRTVLLVATLLAGFLPAHASFYEMRWTTDVGSKQFDIPSTYGPDGPWQAIAVSLGNNSGNGSNSNTFYPGTVIPLYPCGLDFF